MPRASHFTFAHYVVDPTHSTVTFHYRVTFENGKTRTYSDKLFLPDVSPHAWDTLPLTTKNSILGMVSLLIGINYWSAFPTNAISIEGFTLTSEQAKFWNTLYLHGLGEFFYIMQMDFTNLVNFPFDASLQYPEPPVRSPHKRALLLHGAGKDSILSAEMLKESGEPFDLFSFDPSRAHTQVGKLIGARTITAYRRSDPRVVALKAWFDVSNAHPSICTITGIAVLLAELLGYDAILLSNEKSADSGNLTYRGLPVNHQWSKSSESERLIQEYVHRYIAPHLSVRSLLRPYSELEIVRRFLQYPQYLRVVTSCNTYFALPSYMHYFGHSPYWCLRCPKCVFLFACYSAFLPKKDVLSLFGANLYARPRLLPLFRELLGLTGNKPFDCVGEPGEMIVAMHRAARTRSYEQDPAILLFHQSFPDGYDFAELSRRLLPETDDVSH